MQGLSAPGFVGFTKAKPAQQKVERRYRKQGGSRFIRILPSTLQSAISYFCSADLLPKFGKIERILLRLTFFQKAGPPCNSKLPN